VFYEFLKEKDTKRLLTIDKCQGMIAKILRKDFKIMCSTNPTQFNQKKYSHWSNGLLLSPFNNALLGEDIIESRLEGP
jgi:hypothetical protein